MRLVQTLAQSFMALHVPSMGTIHHSAARIMKYLPQVVDVNLSRHLSRHMDRIIIPDLSELETLVCSIEAKLPLAHELRLLQNIASSLALLQPPVLTPFTSTAENVMNKITQTNDKKIIKTIYQAEQYHRAEETFWQLAHWAGGNLQRWGRVHRKVRESTFLRTIYQYHTRKAHKQFISMTASIGSDSVAWQKAVERCQTHPLLLRELMLRVRKQQKEQIKAHKTTYLAESGPNKCPVQSTTVETDDSLEQPTDSDNTMSLR